MRRTMRLGAMVFGVMALTLIGAGAAAAQTAVVRQMDPLILQAPGSAIGLSIVDGAEEANAGAGAREGVRVQAVRENSPASRAGFRAGDVVVEFDGERVRSARQFVRVVRETRPGRPVEAIVMRDGARQTLMVTPEQDRVQLGQPGNRARPGAPFADGLRRFEFDGPVFDWIMPSRGRLGASVTAMDDQLATYFGVKAGVLVTSVAEGSPAAGAGLRAGDVITSIDDRPVTDPADVTDTLRDAAEGSDISIAVTREKQPLKFQIKLPSNERQAPGRGRIPI